MDIREAGDAFSEDVIFFSTLNHMIPKVSGLSLFLNSNSTMPEITYKHLSVLLTKNTFYHLKK